MMKNVSLLSSCDNGREEMRKYPSTPASMEIGSVQLRSNLKRLFISKNILFHTQENINVSFPIQKYNFFAYSNQPLLFKRNKTAFFTLFIKNDKHEKDCIRYKQHT